VTSVSTDMKIPRTRSLHHVREARDRVVAVVDSVAVATTMVRSVDIVCTTESSRRHFDFPAMATAPTTYSANRSTLYRRLRPASGWASHPRTLLEDRLLPLHRRGQAADTGLPFLPGLVIAGYAWYLTITTNDAKRTVCVDWVPSPPSPTPLPTWLLTVERDRPCGLDTRSVRQSYREGSTPSSAFCST
jgi:hypothetical protein